MHSVVRNLSFPNTKVILRHNGTRSHSFIRQIRFSVNSIIFHSCSRGYVGPFRCKRSWSGWLDVLACFPWHWENWDLRSNQWHTNVTTIRFATFMLLTWIDHFLRHGVCHHWNTWRSIATRSTSHNDLKFNV